MAKKKKLYEELKNDKVYFKYVGPLDTVTSCAGIVKKGIPFEVDVKFVPELQNKKTFMELTVEDYENWKEEKRLEIKEKKEDFKDKKEKIEEELETIVVLDDILEDKEKIDDNESGKESID